MTLDILNQISIFFNFFSIILCHGLVPRWEEAVFGFGGTPHFIVYNISSASGGQECQPQPAASVQNPGTVKSILVIGAFWRLGPVFGELAVAGRKVS